VQNEILNGNQAWSYENFRKQKKVKGMIYSLYLFSAPNDGDVMPTG